MSETRKVVVHSWHSPESCGGFDWYPDTQAGYIAATEAFVKDTGPDNPWGGDPVRVRLLTVDVPADLDGQALTDWLDEDIDALEETLPALWDVSLNMA